MVLWLSSNRRCSALPELPNARLRMQRAQLFKLICAPGLQDGKARREREAVAALLQEEQRLQAGLEQLDGEIARAAEVLDTLQVCALCQLCRAGLSPTCVTR